MSIAVIFFWLVLCVICTGLIIASMERLLLGCPGDLDETEETEKELEMAK